GRVLDALVRRVAHLLDRLRDLLEPVVALAVLVRALAPMLPVVLDRFDEALQPLLERVELLLELLCIPLGRARSLIVQSALAHALRVVEVDAGRPLIRKESHGLFSRGSLIEAHSRCLRSIVGSLAPAGCS